MPRNSSPPSLTPWIPPSGTWSSRPASVGRANPPRPLVNMLANEVSTDWIVPASIAGSSRRSSELVTVDSAAPISVICGTISPSTTTRLMGMERSAW